MSKLKVNHDSCLVTKDLSDYAGMKLSVPHVTLEEIEENRRFLFSCLMAIRLDKFRSDDISVTADWKLGSSEIQGTKVMLISIQSKEMETEITKNYQLVLISGEIIIEDDLNQFQFPQQFLFVKESANILNDGQTLNKRGTLTIAKKILKSDTPQSADQS